MSDPEQPPVHKPSWLPNILRLLPQSEDAEKGVLCSFLLAPTEVGDYCIEKGIARASFHIPAHGELYEAMQTILAANKPLDFIVLTEHMRAIKRLDQVGGAAYVTDLFTFLPTAANLAYYVEIVQEKHTLREIIKVCTEYAARSYDEQDNVPNLLDEMERKVLAIADNRILKDAREISAIVAISKANFEKAHEIGMLGISTGMKDVDEATGGLAEELIVIQAKSSDGKTSLAMTWAANIALDQRRPVGIISLEMPAEDLVTRMVSGRSQVVGEEIFEGKITMPEEFTTKNPIITIAEAFDEISKAPLFIDDQQDVTVQEIAAKLRRMKKRHHIEAAFIDYIQLIKGAEGTEDKRYAQLDEIGKGLKNLSRELRIPVVVLSQVNSAGEVAGSKAIVFHADKLIGISTRGDGTYLRMNKKRNGRRETASDGDGGVEVWFDRPTFTFRDIDQKPKATHPAPGKKTKSR